MTSEATSGTGSDTWGAGSTAGRTDPEQVLAVLDWRRRVHALHAQVRELPDPAAGHARWRAGRDELFAHHPASPLLPRHRRTFAGLPVAGYDPAWRFEVAVEPVTEPHDDADDVFDARTATDGTVPFRRLGRVRLPTAAGTVRLDAWRLAAYGGGVFLPIRDAGSGQVSYGAGRYLLDTVKGADLGPGAAPGTVVVDLNFAYSPSCAYDPAWACPLAPLGNRTDVAVPVGELDDGRWA